MQKIVDYFLFFNEKELLELRLNLFKDIVDEFVITESSHTFSGNKKDFICKELVKELGFENKTTVLEIDYDAIELVPNETDAIESSIAKSYDQVFSWTRERTQRDGLISILHKYEDDVVFISSDCDEIINPIALPYFANIARTLESGYLKVPLVLLEGKANQRLFMDDNPASWNSSLVVCNAKQLKNGATPSNLRGEYNCPIRPVWLTQNEETLKDCGWHFTWMGKDRRKEKSQSFAHHANMSVVNTLSVESFRELVNDENLVEEYKNKCNYILKDYPIEFLPQIIFDLPRVKEFLLP